MQLHINKKVNKLLMSSVTACKIGILPLYTDSFSYLMQVVLFRWRQTIYYTGQNSGKISNDHLRLKGHLSLYE